MSRHQCLLKIDFLCFSHWFSAITFLFLILAICVCDESSRKKLGPTSPNDHKLVAQTDFLYVDEGFAIN